MRRRVSLFVHGAAVCSTLAACVGVSTPASAYDLTGAGGSLGITTPEDRDATLAGAGHLEFQQQGSRVRLLPSVMYWNTSRTSDLSANFDLSYRFEPQGHLTPYLGGGVGVNRMRSDATDHSQTNLGANLLGGVSIPGGANRYFVEGRFTATDVAQMSILGGVTFALR